MFSSMSFGAAVEVLSLEQYQRVSVPAVVQQFMSGQIVNGKYSQLVPLQRMLQEYEDIMTGVMNGLNAHYESFKPGMETLKNAQLIVNDLNFFKEYMTMKFQVMNNWPTANAANEFFSRYFGGFPKYAAVSKWINDQSSLALQEKLDQGALLKSDVFSKMSGAKADFYVNKIVPNANNFSKADKDFLRDIFVLKMDGAVSLPDVVKMLTIMKPYMTVNDYGPVMIFAPQMVLGPDLAVGTLNSDSDLPYGKRNVTSEIQEITNKFNAVTSRLNPYLPNDIGSLFAAHIDNWKKGYYDPSNSKYSVSPTGNQIMKDFTDAIYAAITPIISGSSPSIGVSATNEAIRQAAITKGDAAIDANTTLSPEAVEQAKAMLRSVAETNLTQAPPATTGGFLPLLAIGGLALYLLKKR